MVIVTKDRLDLTNFMHLGLVPQIADNLMQRKEAVVAPLAARARIKIRSRHEIDAALFFQLEINGIGGHLIVRMGLVIDGNPRGGDKIIRREVCIHKVDAPDAFASLQAIVPKPVGDFGIFA